MDLSPSEWAMLVAGGLLFAWVVWFLVRNGILGPPKVSRSQDEKSKS
jgi:hypothetical protein